MVLELREYSTNNSKERKDMTELKECPYCGGDGEIYVYSASRDKKLYLVRCENCGNGTCADEDVYTAIKLWNARISEQDDDDNVIHIYISMPESGLTENEKYEIQKELCEEASDFLEATVELIEPCIEEGSNEFQALASRVKSMSEADYVIFPDGWELKRECRIDYTIAGEYGKKILTGHGNKLQEEL